MERSAAALPPIAAERLGQTQGSVHEFSFPLPAHTCFKRDRRGSSPFSSRKTCRRAHDRWRFMPLPG